MNNARETLSLDSGWLFHKGDFTREKMIRHMATYDLCKGNRGSGAAAPGFDDSSWEHVQVPHDFLIGGTPAETENSFKGSYPRPNGWYRRYFRLDEADCSKRLTILFDGVGTHSVIWVNGHLLHRSFSGYTGFHIDISDVALFGEQLNVISVYVKNHESEGWWYEGAGIYRHVWLIKTGMVSVDHWGTFVKPKQLGQWMWQVGVSTELRNDQCQAVEGHLKSSVCQIDGSRICSTESAFILQAKTGTSIDQALLVTNPVLWSLGERNMYVLLSEVYVDGVLMDTYTTKFGFRTIRFDPDLGFFLNDENMKLKGLCIHQDHGGLGVAVPDSVQRFRVAALKESGANALRSTHNMPAPELLDACDELGMLVMDENRWLNSSKNRIHELESMIRRDRNHPSVILWSVFNEDPIMTRPAGAAIYKAMATAAGKLDNSRPIIGAPVKNVANPAYISSLEVMGFNYNFDKVDMLHKVWHKAHINTETHQGNYQGGNDGWRLAALRPFVAGIFCWGIETRGETYWPRLFAPWGIMDGLCYPKAHFYLYKHSYWADQPSIKIVTMLDYPKINETSPCWLQVNRIRYSTHWNWLERAGQLIDVWVYTNTQVVELFLNGQSLGQKLADPFEQVCWSIPYEPGELVAVGRDIDGHDIVSDRLKTTGRPAGLRMMLHNSPIKADGADCAVITAQVVDADGKLVPNADGSLIRFSVNDRGAILATANNDPTDHHVLTEHSCQANNGLCQLIVRSSARSGDLVIKASAAGLGENEMIIQRVDSARAVVPEVASRYETTIQVGNLFADLPDAVEADGHGEIKWIRKPLNHELFDDLPNQFCALPYRLDTVIPESADGYKALLFENIAGKLHVQARSLDSQEVIDRFEQNGSGELLLDLSQYNSGEHIRIYITSQIDPPRYFGPNPYWRFAGIKGDARWILKPES